MEGRRATGRPGHTRPGIAVADPSKRSTGNDDDDDKVTFPYGPFDF